MAKKEDVKENIEKKTTTKSNEKKISTGNTAKIVRTRSSSVAAKNVNKKEDSENPKEKKEAVKQDIKNNEQKEKIKSKNAREEKAKETKKDKKKLNEDEKKKTEAQPQKKVKKKAETQLQEKTTKEIEETVGKEIKQNKKLPNSELEKINSRVFYNICLAVVVMFYLNFVILGYTNIENSVFITDLKVFSIALLAVSIGLFEYAYKKDSGRFAIHGIEILMLALVTMILIYVELMWSDKFIYIAAFVIYVFAIYYVAKSIIIYSKMKKEYFLTEMKEIIKK